MTDTALRLHQQMMQTVLGDIAKGLYPPGERLPPEMELAGKLGVSRGVVRELHRSLEDRSVIEIRHGRGAWVRPMADWDVLDADVLAAIMPTPASVGVLAHYLECRRILETAAAELAAYRATGADLSKMADALARMTSLAVESQTDPEADRLFHEADIAFHSAIFEASGNHVLPLVVEPIQHVMGTLRPRLALHPEHRVLTTIPEHKAILAAIADHDPVRSREAMATHLGTVEAYLEEYGIRLGGKTPEGGATVDSMTRPTSV